MSESETPKVIQLMLAGRPYSLQVKPATEQTFIELARELNDQIDRFQIKYPDRDRQDCLAMVLLSQAVDLYRVRHDTKSSTVANRLKEINQLLDSLLDQDAV